MKPVIGAVFTLFVVATAAFAFSPRHGARLPPTTERIDNQLVLAAASAGDRLVAAGERGRIFVSDDRGAQWHAVATPADTTLTALQFADARRGWAVGHDMTILRTDDGGLRWQRTHHAPERQQPLFDISVDAAGRGFAVGAYGALLESADGGATWQERRIAEEGSVSAEESDMHLNVIVRGADGTVLIAGEAGTLLRSRDGGTRWQRLSPPYNGSFFGALALEDGGFLVFGMRGRIFRSADGGDSWEAVAAGTSSSLFGGHVLADGRVVLVGQDGTVLVSGDRGRTFAREEKRDARAYAALLAPAGTPALIFGEGGVRPLALAAPSPLSLTRSTQP